jgi:hypothetical protein
MHIYIYIYDGQPVEGTCSRKLDWNYNVGLGLIYITFIKLDIQGEGRERAAKKFVTSNVGHKFFREKPQV